MVRENLDRFEQFISQAPPGEKPAKEFTKAHEAAIVDYFFYVEKSKPALFRTLQDIVLGSILTGIVHSDRFADAKDKFSTTRVYLDSNFLFSLLGLRFDEQNKPVQELLELLKSQQCFELRVFDFTIDEISNVLKRYPSEQYLYPPGVKVNSLYASMKAQGWSSAEVRTFLVNVEKKLWQMGITISPTGIDLSSYEPKQPEVRAILMRHKPSQGQKEQNHDLAAIDTIRSIRKRPVHRIEESGAIFLSSDVKLAKYNYIEDKHKERATVSEVIPDKLLTNLLWLKHPTLTSALRLENIVSMPSRQLFIDRDVWARFYDNLTELRKKGAINDLDATILIYDTEIQHVLSEMDPEDIATIEAQWLLDQVMSARKRLSEEEKQQLARLQMSYDEQLQSQKQELAHADEIHAKEEETLKSQLSDSEMRLRQLDGRLRELERQNGQRETSVMNAIGIWKKKKGESAEKVASAVVTSISSVALIAVYFLAFVIIGPIVRSWNFIAPVAWMVSLLVPVTLMLLGKKIDPWHWRDRLRERLFNKLYRSRLAEVEQVESTLLVINTPAGERSDGTGE